MFIHYQELRGSWGRTFISWNTQSLGQWEIILIKELYIFFPHLLLGIRKWCCDPFHYNITKYLQENIKNKHKRQDGVKETVSSPPKSLLQSPQHTRESKTNMPQVTSSKGLERGRNATKVVVWKGMDVCSNCFSNQPSLSEVPSLVCSEFQTRLNF